MAKRGINRLTARTVATAGVGYHCDGDSLYLQVTQGGDGSLNRSWLVRYATGEIKMSASGKSRRAERQMGLGPYPRVSLKEAREKAQEALRLTASGQDPVEAKRASKSSAALANAKAMSFAECAEAYIRSHEHGWRNDKHRAQSRNTLATYAHPAIGPLPVAGIDVGLVLKVLEPIWVSKPETASRLRGRIEAILDWARARGFREGENPARWRGHLDKLLPARSKIRRVEHHAALPYSAIPSFMGELHERDATAARALEFTILTAARTGEVIGVTWDEIDLRERVWTIPASRMKGGRQHRVPLSDAAITILETQAQRREGKFVFSGGNGRALSNMALLMLLRRMGLDVTAHGFRSSFRDWAGDCTHFPREVIEAALAHVVESKVEAAYRRSDAIEKRRKLMDAWARFCVEETQTGEQSL
ncbi:site-specific integrase [Methylocystis sp. Sn-Cys]|uniref:tyrosine-type recombinase/integrase n=1 Tax=Methylocystis sp. Sn-Cys TaxID=1701263 RepID=UPI0019225F6C|nr:site-specific integrase [Methylocystis sp. Sn-Cys]MBL1258003.1 integrase arm-type DNA-binding domain-containing protein [Methylocystis sp. Sn-Cys]